MNAKDIKPTRLIRAKQKIEDFLNRSQGVKIGLIAFAADPHMITPLTEDKETIRHLLPSLNTDLVYVQGSRLSSALEMASAMLESEPGNNKALLVISDGGFEDASAIAVAKKLVEKGIIIHAMGVGTPEGAPMHDRKGNVVKKNGNPILATLDKDKLMGVAVAGNGHYLEARYDSEPETIIFTQLEKNADTQINENKKRKFWDERFYLFIFPSLPFLLWWFRRGYLFAILLIFISPTFGVEATDVKSFFKNSEEIGKDALENGDYETAVLKFQDPYKKGVCCYRAGQYAEAEKLFRESCREEVASQAAYNLGNTLVQQQKLKEALEAYEEVLKRWPDHTKARENLEIVKQMLQQQNQEDSQQQKSDQQSDSNSQQNSSDKSNDHENQEGQKSDQDQQNGNQDKPNPNQNESSSNQDKHNSKQDKSSSNQDESNSNQEEQNFNQDKQNPNQEEQASNQDSQELRDSQIEEKSGSEQKGKASKTQKDLDADVWLNRITNDQSTFLKNKFYIESKKNGTKEGIDPW
jgi:Ca-activated chloride channel family protein